MVLSLVMQGRPGLVVFSSSPEVRLTGSSGHLHCHPYRLSRRDWIIAVSLVCFVSLHASSFQTNWCHLMPSSIHVGRFIRFYHADLFVS